MQSRGHAVLEHRPALIGELVAHGACVLRVKYGRVMFDFIAVRTGDGVLVTLPAAACIELRTKTDLRRERAVEHGTTAIESRPLGGGQPGQRLARLRRPAARRGAAHDQESDPAACHGTPATIRPMRSMVYATKPVGRPPNETRITSPGFSAARLIGAPCVPFRSVIGMAAGTCSRTTRRAKPTPVVTSSVRARVFTLRIAPRTLSCGAVGATCCAVRAKGTSKEARDSSVIRRISSSRKGSGGVPLFGRRVPDHSHEQNRPRQVLPQREDE